VTGGGDRPVIWNGSPFVGPRQAPWRWAIRGGVGNWPLVEFASLLVASMRPLIVLAPRPDLRAVDPRRSGGGLGGGGFCYAAAGPRSPRCCCGSNPAKGIRRADVRAVIVWVTDSGGYFAGARHRRSQALARQVSPKKTLGRGGWAVFVASLAVACGFCGVRSSGGPCRCWSRPPFLSVASQPRRPLRICGKAAVSGSRIPSHIIPGHGGLMDRLDGFCRGRRPWAAIFSGSCVVVPMASGAVLWFGETMSAVPFA